MRSRVPQIPQMSNLCTLWSIYKISMNFLCNTYNLSIFICTKLCFTELTDRRYPQGPSDNFYAPRHNSPWWTVFFTVRMDIVSQMISLDVELWYHSKFCWNYFKFYMLFLLAIWTYFSICHLCWAFLIKELLFFFSFLAVLCLSVNPY